MCQTWLNDIDIELDVLLHPIVYKLFTDGFQSKQDHLCQQYEIF